ncbi:MAG: 50S ribosomal protein L17 [Candidatus Omnitrophota bacterium]
MRHRKKYRRLSRFGSSRNALLRNMAIALLRYEKITTTLAKAKEIRGIIDKLINFGKKNTLNSRRAAYRVLQNREIVDKLFKEIAPRFKDINSGFTRIIHYRNRKGDGALLAIVELVIRKPEEKKEIKKEEKKKKIPLTEVKKREKVKEEAPPTELEEKKEKTEVIPEVKEEKEEKEKKEEKEVKEVKEEVKGIEPTPPPRTEKTKGFWEGIRGLFKKRKDKEI